jgi:lysophospholipase L1-like esterase
MKLSFALTTHALALAVALILAPQTRAETPPAKPATTPAAPAKPTPAPTEPADQPSPKKDKDGVTIQPGFKGAHENFLKRGKEPIGILFLGDSITAGWGKAKPVWDEHYGKYQPANFGIGGDKTQHVLWRIANGELDGIQPKVLVLMIGTNNMGYPVEDIIKGDLKIVEEIHKKLPQTKLLLLGIFPRGPEATNPARAKIKTVNEALAKLEDGKTTRYLDIGDKFLDASGNLPKDIMPDSLHPNAAGYKIWADATQPLLDEMLK